MPVYSGALHDSQRNNKKQFVIERGLDIFRTDDVKRALYFLCGGWNIKAVCENGVLKSQWLLDLTSDDFIQKYPTSLRIADLLELLPDEERYITIKTHEFFDHFNRPERLMMWVEKRETPYSKAECIQITPENEGENLEKFKAGQKKAQMILDILTVSGIKQDKDSLIRLLQKEPISDLI